MSFGVLCRYGREESADTLIEQLTLDKDPILRWVPAAAALLIADPALYKRLRAAGVSRAGANGACAHKQWEYVPEIPQSAAANIGIYIRRRRNGRAHRAAGAAERT